MKPNEPVLIIAAHPDDEILGVGGTMARLSNEGRSVTVVFVATGVAARYANPELHAEEISREVEALKENVAATKSSVGVERHIFLDYPDNRLDTIPLMDITHSLREVVREVKPETVFTHHFGDYNWDHRVVFEATLMACRANKGDVYPRSIYSYEVLSSTERGFQGGATCFAPGVYVDITDTLESKLAAMRCYVTELGEYPHPRSIEAVRNKALCRGAEVNVQCAEAFQLVRRIHEGDLNV